MSYPLVMDVSSYQPDDGSFFKSAKAAGVQAVIVKLTEGSNPGTAYINPKARNQINNARAAGLLVHGYHYAKFNGNNDARAEADWFVKVAKTLGVSNDSIMALDIEDASNAYLATSDANAFIQRVKDLGYGKTDVYSMASWFWSGRLVPSQLIAKNLWVANYGVSAPGVDNVGLWQFTSTYNIGGNKVDMSYDFNGFYTSGQTPIGTPDSKKGWVETTAYANLRKGPGTNYGVSRTMGPGERYNYYAVTQNGDYTWYRLTPNEWVASAGAKVIAAPVASAPSRVAQSGTFRATVTVNVRSAPSLSAGVVATYSPGQSVQYDSYIDADGIRWISYVGASGNRRYVARKKLDGSAMYGDAY
jgi:GH25 family lysozyme M1 (1,4-beta-N-acetylmuramidase)/uncharacterized protein YraI